MSRFVRSSKYRHVFGKANKREETYDNLNVSRSAWDSNKAAVNGKFVAFPWEAGGGGSLMVLPLSKYGKQPASPPLIVGHKAAVLDVAFSTFDDNLVVSVSEDGTAKVWQVPDEGFTKPQQDPVQTLNGHKRKVGTCNFNPAAENVLATSSTDFAVKLWDIEKGVAHVTIEGKHSDIINDLQWNYDGSLFATICKDKKVRIIDPRSAGVTAEFVAHEGVKGSRLIWAGKSNRIYTVGFSKTSDRQHALWETKGSISDPQARGNIDTASGLLMPFYDEDTDVLYLAGKGDGNIRYYELTTDGDYIYPLSEYKSAVPQKGMAFLAKRHLKINECEIARAYKVTNTQVEPISFFVPRKSDMFQDDIYPPTRSDQPSESAAEFFAGTTRPVVTVSLEKGFVARPPTEKSFEKKEEEVVTGPKDEKELRAAYEKALNRIAYLEAELAKLQAK